MRSWTWLIAGCLIVGACSGGNDAAPPEESTAQTEQSVPTPPSDAPSSDSSIVAPPSSDTPEETTTTAGGTTSPPSQQTLPTGLSTDTCAWTGPPSAGSVTFVSGNGLFEVGADGTPTCLAQIDPADSGPLRWSPDGTRLLVGGATVAGDFGQRDTGYFPENLDVGWSAPSGKAFIAPSVRDGGLVWRNSANPAERIDVSFLNDTVAATYHPAGKAIAAVGVNEGGTTGIFLASNRGEDRQQLTFLEDSSTTITDLAWDSAGVGLEFLHDHGDFYELHHISFTDTGIVLSDVVAENGDASHLVVSTVRLGDVAWQRAENGQSTVRASFAGAPIVTLAPTDASMSITPVGWLDGELVVVQRPIGDDDAPGELLAWAAGADTPRTLYSGVERSAVRIVRDPYSELPNVIVSEAEA